MRILLILLILFSINLHAEKFGDNEIPHHIDELVVKLRNQIFQNGDYSLVDDIFSSSSYGEVSSFIETLEKTGDPNTIRAYLNYLSLNNGTQVRYLEALKKKVASNPQSLRKIKNTLIEIKGEMKRANLRFPTPIRCASGIATYVAIQDWFLSYKSSFLNEEGLEDIYKDEIVDPAYKLILGFMITTCLGDAILTVKNSKEYFSELRIDKAVEENRKLFLKLSEDLEHSKTSLSYSKANIDALIYIDQHITELSEKLSQSLNIKMEAQKEKVMKGFKRLYFSYIKRVKHKKIVKEMADIYEKNLLINQIT